MTAGGRLSGKRILITGTAGGQGAAAQRLFCEHGAAVVGCDVLPQGAEMTAERLRGAGHEAYGKAVDLADPDAARKWIEWGAQRLSGIDVLYNNASKPAIVPFETMTADEWRFTIANELDLVFYTTSSAWPYLKRSRGAIINTASVIGIVGEAGLGVAAHAAAKAGVIGLTKQLAAEGGGWGIRANVISPGFVDSPATQQVPDEARRRLVEQTQMLSSTGKPDDIAYLALYLASDESSFVTGANFVIDAGWTASGSDAAPPVS